MPQNATFLSFYFADYQFFRNSKTLDIYFNSGYITNYFYTFCYIQVEKTINLLVPKSGLIPILDNFISIQCKKFNMLFNFLLL